MMTHSLVVLLVAGHNLFLILFVGTEGRNDSSARVLLLFNRLFFVQYFNLVEHFQETDGTFRFYKYVPYRSVRMYIRVAQIRVGRMHI